MSDSESQVPQTAEQINGPQMGNVNVVPPVQTTQSPPMITSDAPNKSQRVTPLPAKLIAKQHLEAQEDDAPGKPDGWWDLRGLSGSIHAVIRAVQMSHIPAYWKAAIVADIGARCGNGHNFVSVVAQYHVEKGQGSLHLTIVPDKKLL